MIGSLHEWIVGIITTIFGALLGLIVTRLDSYLEVRQRSDLKGEWLSISDAGEHDNVRDRVVIAIRRGKLYLKNTEKPYGYEYEAFCRVKDSRIVAGEWRSIRSGASARGALLLQISPQGTTLYGVYSGVHSDGRNLLLGWVLGRNEEALQLGIQTLRTNTMLMHSSQSSTS
jgi:hypothetical protein